METYHLFGSPNDSSWLPSVWSSWCWEEFLTINCRIPWVNLGFGQVGTLSCLPGEGRVAALWLCCVVLQCSGAGSGDSFGGLWWALTVPLSLLWMQLFPGWGSPTAELLCPAEGGCLLPLTRGLSSTHPKLLFLPSPFSAGSVRAWQLIPCGLHPEGAQLDTSVNVFFFPQPRPEPLCYLHSSGPQSDGLFRAWWSSLLLLYSFARTSKCPSWGCLSHKL